MVFGGGRQPFLVSFMVLMKKRQMIVHYGSLLSALWHHSFPLSLFPYDILLFTKKNSLYLVTLLVMHNAVLCLCAFMYYVLPNQSFFPRLSAVLSSWKPLRESSLSKSRFFKVKNFQVTQPARRTHSFSLTEEEREKAWCSKRKELKEQIVWMEKRILERIEYKKTAHFTYFSFYSAHIQKNIYNRITK